MTNLNTYLRDVRIEMSKVSWPTRAQTAKLTMIVIGVSLFAAIFVGGLDFVFSKLIALLLGR